MPPDNSYRKSALILAAFVVIEGGWVLFNLRLSGWRFVRYLGFAPDLAGNLAGWIAALIVTVIFVHFTHAAPRQSNVRRNITGMTILC